MSAEDSWSYHGWLELPFYLGVEHEETLDARVAGNNNQELTLRIVNDLNKIQVGSEWEYRRTFGDWYGQPPEERGEDEPDYTWGTLYVSEDQTAGVVEELRSGEELPYVHVEEVQTVVELEAELPDSVIPDGFAEDDVLTAPLLPRPGFIRETVFPRLNELIGVYRIATLPAMRYGIHPVSEALISYALQKIKSPTGETRMRVGHLLDAHDTGDRFQHDVERLGIQDRFDGLLGEEYAALRPENSFAIIYSLYHLRRWTEALVIASAVMDELLEEAVYELAPDEEFADVLWDGHGHYYQDVFKQVLPLLGTSTLHEVDGDLWADLIQARQFRGRLAHGSSLDAFDRGDKQDVRDHLRTFYRVVRWLSLQMGRDWELDIEDEGELMDPFPS